MEFATSYVQYESHEVVPVANNTLFDPICHFDPYCIFDILLFILLLSIPLSFLSYSLSMPSHRVKLVLECPAYSICLFSVFYLLSYTSFCYAAAVIQFSISFCFL